LDAAVETYTLGNFANTVTLGTAAGNLAQNVTGGSSTDVLTLGANAYTGTWTGISGLSLVAGNTDISGVSDGSAAGNAIAGTPTLLITPTSATLNNVTMTAAQYAGLGAITAAGTGATADKIILSGAGNVTVNAAIETYDLGSTGRTITLGSGSVATTVIDGAGNDGHVFAATAATNGSDSITNFLADGTDTLDFTAFLGGAASVNTTAFDISGSTGSVTGATNVAVAFNVNSAALTASNFQTSTGSGKIAIENNSKAVILVSADADSTSNVYKVYYVEDTDTSSAQTWQVTLVGTLTNTTELSASALAANAVFV
jgi:hypothetical protein